MPNGTGCFREYPRGELRRQTGEYIEKNLDKSFEDIVRGQAKEFDLSLQRSQTHLRWMVREGYVNDPEGKTLKWPKRSKSLTESEVAPAPVPAPEQTPPEDAKPADEPVAESKKKAKKKAKKKLKPATEMLIALVEANRKKAEAAKSEPSVTVDKEMQDEFDMLVDEDPLVAAEVEGGRP